MGAAARTTEPLPPLKVAQPLEDDLPVADAGTNAWWNAVVSTAANSSGAIPVVKASPGPLLTPRPKAPVRGAPGRRSRLVQYARAEGRGRPGRGGSGGAGADDRRRRDHPLGRPKSPVASQRGR